MITEHEMLVTLASMALKMNDLTGHDVIEALRELGYKNVVEQARKDKPFPVTVDPCTGCGAPNCSDLWVSQRKCCPDCSHRIKVREEVLRLAEQMELKLRKNDHKGHWSNCTNTYLTRRLSEEGTELRNALKLLLDARRYPADTAQLEHCRALVVRECADVANFAMMIADNARR